MIPNRENGVNQGQFLPPNWEQAYDIVSNRLFYVDHNTKTTTWLNPMDQLTKPKSASECYDDQLPYGWERMTDPVIGVYYANHIERRNQWTNPVSDWRVRISSQHHYSNSHHILSVEQSANSLDSNNQTTSQTTGDTKPDTSLHASDIDDKFTTSLNNSNTLSTEIIDTMRSSNSRGSKYDASLLDIMDNCFGRKSSQSVEV